MAQSKISSTHQDDISLCNSCGCMTHTIDFWSKSLCCGKCGATKNDQDANEREELALMVKIKEYWTTSSGEPELRGFAKYVLGLMKSQKAALLESLLDEGPKDAQETEWSDKHQRFVLHREEEVRGFNESNDQWRDLIQAKQSKQEEQ